jgi:hypothetical protein
MDPVKCPYRCSIYWKVEGPDSVPVVTVYGLTSLIRLNPTASFIWLLSDGHHSERQILRALKERFPQVPADRLQEDVERFLSQAESQGFLRRRWDPLQPYGVIHERLLA